MSFGAWADIDDEAFGKLVLHKTERLTDKTFEPVALVGFAIAAGDGKPKAW